MSSPPPSGSASQVAASPRTQAKNWKSGPLVGLCAVLPGAILAWLVIHSFHPVFSNEAAADAFGNLPPAVQWQMDRNNAMFVMGLVGALAAAGLAVGEGLSRKSRLTAVAAAAACLVAGLLFGALGGYFGLVAFQRLEPKHELTDLSKAILVYMITFVTLGAGAGLAVGLVLGRSFLAAAKCLLAGGMAGLLAAICYPLLVAAALPGAITKVFIPLGPQERLLWCGILAGLLGLVIPAVANDRRRATVEDVADQPAS